MVPEPKNSPNGSRRRGFSISNRRFAISLAKPTMTRPAIFLFFLYLAQLAPCHAAEPGGHVDSPALDPNGPSDHSLPPLPLLLPPPGLTQHLVTPTQFSTIVSAIVLSIFSVIVSVTVSTIANTIVRVSARRS